MSSRESIEPVGLNGVALRALLFHCHQNVLKYLGLYSRRLGNAGRGLTTDKATQLPVHQLGYSHKVLDLEPGLLSPDAIVSTPGCCVGL